MNRSLRLLFLAHPRSGSSSLYEILQSHPDLNILDEPFNENFTRWDADNKNYRELVHDIPSLEAQVAEIFSDWNGVKILDYQLPSDLIAHLFWSIFKPQCIRFAQTLNIFNLLTASSVCLSVETDINPLTNPCEEKEKRS